MRNGISGHNCVYPSYSIVLKSYSNLFLQFPNTTLTWRNLLASISGTITRHVAIITTCTPSQSIVLQRRISFIYISQLFTKTQHIFSHLARNDVALQAIH